MNLPHLLHETTGRMRKARRRGEGWRKVSRIYVFVFCVWLLLPTYRLPTWARALAAVLAAVAYWRAIKNQNRATVYGRVVDRCQGSILTILAIQHWQVEEMLARQDPRTGDKREWS